METFSAYPDWGEKKLKFRDSPLEKYVLGKKVKWTMFCSCWREQAVTGGSPQLSQQKAGLDMELHRKDLRRPPLSNGVNPHNIHWRAMTFLKERSICQLPLKVKEAGENERRLSESQNSRSKKQIDKTTQLQSRATIQEKQSVTPKAGTWSWRPEPWVQWLRPSTQGLAP